MPTKELSLSWSALRQWTECRQKSYLHRMGRRDPRGDIRQYFHGTVVDRCMRAYLNSEEKFSGQMAQSVKEIMDFEEKKAAEEGDGVVKWKSRADKIEMLEFCQNLVNKLEPILEELVIPNEYEPSKRFRAPVVIPYLDGSPTTVNLIGEMDILVRIPEPHNLWEIWDLKATKNEYYWKTSIGQLVFYDLSLYLLFKQYSARVGLIQPMCKKETVAFTVSDQQRVEMMQRIIQMAHSVWRNEVNPEDLAEIKASPSDKNCYMCGVKKDCYVFKPVGGKLSLGITSLEGIEPDTRVFVGEELINASAKSQSEMIDFLNTLLD